MRDVQPGPLGHLQTTLDAAHNTVEGTIRATHDPDMHGEQIRRSIAYARALLHRAEHHLDNHLTAEEYL